jgi:hypothetical protein
MGVGRRAGKGVGVGIYIAPRGAPCSLCFVRAFHTISFPSWLRGWGRGGGGLGAHVRKRRRGGRGGFPAPSEVTLLMGGGPPWPLPRAHAPRADEALAVARPVHRIDLVEVAGEDPPLPGRGTEGPPLLGARVRASDCGEGPVRERSLALLDARLQPLEVRLGGREARLDVRHLGKGRMFACAAMGARATSTSECAQKVGGAGTPVFSGSPESWRRHQRCRRQSARGESLRNVLAGWEEEAVGAWVRGRWRSGGGNESLAGPSQKNKSFSVSYHRARALTTRRAALTCAHRVASAPPAACAAVSPPAKHASPHFLPLPLPPQPTFPSPAVQGPSGPRRVLPPLLPRPAPCFSPPIPAVHHGPRLREDVRQAV